MKHVIIFDTSRADSVFILYLKLNHKIYNLSIFFFIYITYWIWKIYRIEVIQDEIYQNLKYIKIPIIFYTLYYSY